MRVEHSPLIELIGVTKDYGGERPLRVREFSCVATDRIAISGLDASSVEAFVNLITGAALPGAGTVRTAGRDTREITNDVEWLSSLDRFGLVTERAFLVDVLTVAANLALPITLSIDPMSQETRTNVETLAAAVGLDVARLDAPTSTLSVAERLRLHLGRALAHGPKMILLEDPTRVLGAESASDAFGQALASAATRFESGWLAFTNDDVFVRASGARRLELDRRRGQLRAPGLLTSFLSRLSK